MSKNGKTPVSCHTDAAAAKKPETGSFASRRGRKIPVPPRMHTVFIASSGFFSFTRILFVVCVCLCARCNVFLLHFRQFDQLHKHSSSNSIHIIELILFRIFIHTAIPMDNREQKENSKETWTLDAHSSPNRI